MTSEQKLIELIAEVIDVEMDMLSLDIGPNEIEEWDSVNTLRILTNIESELGIRIPLAEYHQASTIGELSELIRSYK